MVVPVVAAAMAVPAAMVVLVAVRWVRGRSGSTATVGRAERVGMLVTPAMVVTAATATPRCGLVVMVVRAVTVGLRVQVGLVVRWVAVAPVGPRVRRVPTVQPRPEVTVVGVAGAGIPPLQAKTVVTVVSAALRVPVAG